MENKKQMHSIILRAGRRTYFFDVYKTVSDSYYVKIDQSVWQGEKRYLRNNILVFEEDIGKFHEALSEINKYIN